MVERNDTFLHKNVKRKSPLRPQNENWGKKAFQFLAPADWNLLQGELWVAELVSLNIFKCFLNSIYKYQWFIQSLNISKILFSLCYSEGD